MSKQTSIAKHVLETWGAKVQEIPTSTKDECDLLAEVDGVRLLVEEKSKLDDPREVETRRETLSRGEVHGSVLPLRHNNRISGIVRKAKDQLSSTGEEFDHDLRIMWFTGMGYQAETQHYQLMSTLYGSTRVFELDKSQMRPCYFFRNSDFFRYRDHLGGAVASYLVGDTLTMKLCLNPHSERWEQLRDSPYARHLKVGLVDPTADEVAGDAYIVDGDIDRAKEHEVLHYLEGKYGLKRLQFMDYHLASAAIVVPS